MIHRPSPLVVDIGGSRCSKRAHEVREDDYFAGRDEGNPNGPIVPCRVLEVFTRIAPVVRINALGQVIRVSPQHRIHVRDRDFIEVCQLKPGDEFLSDDGRWLPVDSIEDRGEVVPVYNFRLEGYHTYFVGSPEWGFSIWAHNTGCPIPGGQGSSKPIHGNSALSPRTAYLYKLVDKTGKLLKWGITQDLAKRYSAAFMKDKELTKMTQGSRSLMMLAERWAIQAKRGPLNHERIRGLIQGML